jgi:putative nucleotidyltransferase with HDIG domain
MVYSHLHYILIVFGAFLSGLLISRLSTLRNPLKEKVDELPEPCNKENETYVNTIRSLVKAVDEKDHYTRYHSENVTKYAVAIAEELGLSQKEVQKIQRASQLHDIGKIGIPQRILNKPGSLTDEEWVEIRLHPSKGANILEPLKFLEGIIGIVKHHHERYDGGGYPDGLKGKQISLSARILAVADSYDAMLSERPYRKAMSKDKARNELKKESGKQFDPHVVEVFLKLLEVSKV